MTRMALHLEDLLTSSNKPLSFIVFVPDWRTPVTPGIVTMEKSKFLRADLVLPGGKYEYVLGSQHLSEDRHFVLPFATHVYILQNEEGFRMWTPTKEKVEDFEKELLAKIDRY